MFKLKQLATVVMTVMVITTALPASAYRVSAADQSQTKFTKKNVDGVYMDFVDNYTFILDKEAVGEWEIYDFVDKINDFDPAIKRKDVSKKEDVSYRGSSIYEDGTMVRRLNEHSRTFRWTKGFMLWEDWKTVPAYEIKSINGDKYMFVEWKGNYYQTKGEMPGYNVFIKTSDKPSGWEKLQKLNKFTDGLRPKVKAEYDKWSDKPADERDLPKNLNVPLHVMWLIYTDVRLNRIDLKMTQDYIELILEAMDDFEEIVENLTDYNVDIINEYMTVDRHIDIDKTEVRVPDGGHVKYITPEIAQPEIRKYAPAGNYNYVFTFSPTNNDAAVGMSLKSMADGQGYSSLPCLSYSDSLWNNQTVLHEFLHSFEFNDFPTFLPGIEMPYVHAINGGRSPGVGQIFPGYEGYKLNGKFFLEGAEDEQYTYKFLELILKANVKYTDPATKKMKYVGIYPSMWEYIVEYQTFLSKNK
jgi:hypothetical protein